LKFDRLRYMVKSRLGSKEFQNAPERFPGKTAAELMASGLAAEQRGDWQDAINRYMEAKQKNLHAPGLLFHVGKLATEHNDYEAADHAFDYAIKFGENLAASYQYRGLIAMRRSDFEAAESYFASSAATDPFPSANYFFWAEALRALGRPAEAVRRYEEAAQRDESASAKTLCRFKVRLARIEGTDAAAVEAEIRRTAEAGPLTPDWLLTEAALQIRRGEMKQASALISQARATGVVGTFVPFANDTIFRTAAAKFPEIAVALGPLTPIGTDTWNPKPLQLAPGLGRRGPLPRP
ncbi:MAG: hypothetical protein M3Y03_06105, partial [Verrucomicrobiota bacterium]|nr:hypothetical protein [Verrucomicrobiota bacterium]